MNALAPAAAAVAADDEGLDRRRLAVLVEQTTKLRLQILATALVIAALVWRAVPAPLVVGWLLLVVCAREVRSAWLRRAVADPKRPVASTLARVVASNLALGAVNGSAALFMVWVDPTRDALLTMILVSWAAGAVSISALVRRAFYAYAGPIFVPTAAMWLLRGDATGFGVCALVLMFAHVQHGFAVHNRELFEASYRIRQENEALLAQLAAARDAAESASRAKSRFLAIASHDLRQPLHALSLHSGLLALNPQSADTPAIAGEISASVDSLSQALDSLLDLSKLDAGVVAVERRPIQLHRLIAHLVRSHAPQAATRGLGLRLECPLEAVVDADPVLLERLLRNLLDNALKYTDAGEVCIVATADDSSLQVCVRDTGRGIPLQAQALVFDEFFQVDAQGRRTERGLGLGLAIVRRLAELMALPLQLRSEPGVGTAVTLTLPRAAHFDSVAPPAPADQAALAGLKVLFVDDEPAVRRAMASVLQRFGCAARGAGSSAEALAAADAEPPDLVLADCRLGDGDSGVDAVLRLRARWPALPALLISGDTDAASRGEAEHHGLRLLHKPLTLQRLRDAMTEALRASLPAPPPPEEKR